MGCFASKTTRATDEDSDMDDQRGAISKSKKSISSSNKEASSKTKDSKERANSKGKEEEKASKATIGKKLTTKESREVEASKDKSKSKSEKTTKETKSKITLIKLNTLEKSGKEPDKRSKEGVKPSKERTSSSGKSTSGKLVTGYSSETERRKRPVKEDPVEKKESKSRDSKTRDKPVKEVKSREIKDVKDRGVKEDAKKGKAKVAPITLRPIIKTKAFDDMPISQAKNVATKSWWEMEDEGNSVESFEPPIQLTSSKPDLRSQRVALGSRKRVDDDSNRSNDIINDFLDKPSYVKTYSSEKVKDSRMESREGRKAGSSYRKEEYEDSPRTGGFSRSGNSRRSNEAQGNFGFSALKEDLLNDALGIKQGNKPIKIEIPFDDIDSDRPSGAGTGSWRSQENDQGFAPPARFNRNRFAADAPPLNGMGDEDDSYAAPSPGRFVKAPPFAKGPRPFAGGSSRYGAAAEDDFSDFGGNGGARGGFDEDSQGFGSLPSRPRNVPGANPFGQDDWSEGATGPRTLPPRPKFKRPMPLKRGAGFVNRKAAPVVRSPVDVANGILIKIPDLAESKFTEHLKLQKELIDQIKKSPQVLSNCNIPDLLKTARKITEIAATNRTNLSKSSLICLGYMFEIVGSELNPLVLDSMTLCAKKGVSSSPDHLVLASNFCLSRICQTAPEAKVASILLSLSRNNKAYQIMTLSGFVVLLDRMGDNLAKLKNLEEVVDIGIKGTTTGGVPARVASRNLLGLVRKHANLDRYLNLCKCTPIAKVTINQVLSKYDDESKDSFVEDFAKPIEL